MISHRIGCVVAILLMLASALVMGLLLWGAVELVAGLLTALGAVGVTVGLAKQAEGR
jgi:small-conductance mechanosensitive channel